MSRNLYAVTALVDGEAVGGFTMANNPDEVMARSSARLPEGAKVTHIVPICDARPGTLQRNGLICLCPDEDQIQFAVENLLRIIETLISQVETLKQAIQIQTGIIIDDLGYSQFTFTVLLKSGTVQLHENFAPTIEVAERAANHFAQAEYGEGSKVVSIRKVEK